MSTSVILNWLLICGLINMGILMLWVMMFLFAHDWMYGYHGKWFKLPVEKFDAIHYSGMMFLKLFIFVFNFVPAVALLIASS